MITTQDLIKRSDYWVSLLSNRAFVVTSRKIDTTANSIELRAERCLGDPRIPDTHIKVDELWIELQLAKGSSNQLYAAGWHAQFSSLHDDRWRVDRDPLKPPRLLIHEHVEGHPNSFRRRLVTMPRPVEWMDEIEERVALRLARTDLAPEP